MNELPGRVPQEHQAHAGLPKAGKNWSRRWWLVAGPIAGAIALGLVAVLIRTPKNADPRVDFPTPYLNVRPNIAYVGQARCAVCHQAEAESFNEHPMGKSIGSVADYFPIERYDTHNPFQRVGYEYRIRKVGARVFHREKKVDGDGKLVFEKEVEIHYGVGGAFSGRSFLIERGGFLLQSSISWYPQRQTWDLAPGYNQSAHHPHFERPVTADCLYCHADRIEPIPGTLNRYREPVNLQPIGCERCHGPGELHVRRHENAEEGTSPDLTIVNPKRLEPALRDAVCEQCHIHAEISVAPRGRNLLEYRPGLPLHLFQAIFLSAPQEGEPNRFGHRVDQMQSSACYQMSEGRLGCISCHDPHRVPAAKDKAGFYRARCQRCHDEDSKHCRVSRAERILQSSEDDCTHCHMPRSATDLVHISLTDHRVQRPGQAAPRPAPRDGQPLVRVHQRLLKPGEGRREWDIATAQYAENHGLPQLYSHALISLEVHLAKYPDDLGALEMVGLGRMKSSDAAGAVECFERILAIQPDFERVLSSASLASERLGMDAKAIAYLERAIEVNPYSSQYRVTLGHLWMKQRKWERAMQAGEEALKLNPASLDARRLMVLLHHRQGHRPQALAAWQAFAALDPPDKEELRRLVAD